MCTDSPDFAGRGIMQLYMNCTAQYSLCKPTFTFAELKQKAGRTLLLNPSSFGLGDFTWKPSGLSIGCRHTLHVCYVCLAMGHVCNNGCSSRKKFCSEDTCQCPQFGVYMIILFALESNISVAIL